MAYLNAEHSRHQQESMDALAAALERIRDPRASLNALGACALLREGIKSMDLPPGLRHAIESTLCDIEDPATAWRHHSNAQGVTILVMTALQDWLEHNQQ